MCNINSSNVFKQMLPLLAHVYTLSKSLVFRSFVGSSTTTKYLIEKMAQGSDKINLHEDELY